MSDTKTPSGLEVFNPLEYGIAGKPLMVSASEHNKLVSELQAKLQKAEEKVSTQQNTIMLLEEDIECVHKCLDDEEIPRVDDKGEEYSVWGRIYRLKEKIYKVGSDAESAAMQPQWIPVSEKPIPRSKEGVSVLILFDDDCDHFNAFDECLYNRNSNNQNEWENIDKHATHWQLFTPPKGEK